MNKITILGSGTSTGVPILGCNCTVCKSTDLRNRRLRTSALVQTSHGLNFLIDASPDLRAQLLREKISSLDGVIITHDHADHTHGMDDLRPFSFRSQKPLPVLADAPTSLDLKRKFPYIFDREEVFAHKPVLGGGIPLLDLKVVSAGSFKLAQEAFQFSFLPHGHTQTMAIRHDKMGYIVDCKSIPEETIRDFHHAQLEILIIDCLRPLPHQTHLHLDLALEYIAAMKPRTAVLTHLGHEWDYLDLLDQLERRGIKNVFPAVDGQSFTYSK